MRRVFLSSVGRGLQEYRNAVYKAIAGLDGYHCVRMEDFGARDAGSHSVCIGKVRECEAFIGILGHEYGSVSPETGKSFSESEYDAAVASRKPVLMFLAPEEFPIHANMIESDEVRERQNHFRSRVLTDRQVAFFESNSEEVLAKQVVQAIHNRRDELLQEGLIFQGRTISRLLFPFVTNQAGFDTGLAISNVSHDPFGTEKQEGTCTIHYYGRLAGGRRAPESQTSSMIRAGEQLIFTLSNGGSGLILPVPGFQGYLIAECRFKAAGLAHISDVGCQRVASCYTAQAI